MRHHQGCPKKLSTCAHAGQVARSYVYPGGALCPVHAVDLLPPTVHEGYFELSSSGKSYARKDNSNFPIDQTECDPFIFPHDNLANRITKLLGS